MKYKDYLKTEHWKNFRKNIYAKRKNCQNCGTSKKTLNLHHKNYNNLWKETNTDVIILCQECHYRFHKKKKWIKLLKSRDELDFTRVSDNAVKMNKIYSIKSKEERMCKRCGEMHPIYYKQYKTFVRLVTICPNSRPRLVAIFFEKDLDIPLLGERNINILK